MREKEKTVILNNWGLPILILLVIFDLMIAATRVSLSNARTLKLAAMQTQKPVSAKRAIELHESSRLVAVMRLSQTMMRFGIGIIGFLYLQTWTLNTANGWIIQLIGLFTLAIITMLIEFNVESNALADPEEWATRLSAFAQILLIIFTPFVLLPLLLLNPEHISRGTMAQMTEDELKNWVESDDDENGSLEREERRMIYEIFQFGKTMAREIMTPRIDVIALDIEGTDLSTAQQALLESGFSRLPVYNESIDDILGLLYAKDLLPTLQADQQEFNLRAMLREPYFVPETKKADELLAEMQEKRFHLAIVVDEYGGVSGIVTLEDIIEEIIGEIQDEYDEREEAPFKKISDNEYIFRGVVDVDDFCEIMNVTLPDGDADTLAGFIYEQLRRVPQGGESVRVNGLTLSIEQISGRRIRRVRATRNMDAANKESNDESAE